MPGRDMTLEEFRQYGHQVVDWIADYRGRVEQFPVLSQVKPGWVRAQMPTHAPEQGGDFDGLLADLERVVLPGLTHWQHPSFFGFFPANASMVSVLGDLLSTGIGIQGMLWSSSPACTEVEQVMLDQLAEAMGLPASFTFPGGGGGVLQDTASSAALVALLAALHRHSPGWRESGVRGDEVVYVSSQTHSSVAKAARMAGLGEKAVRALDVDSELALSMPALVTAIEDDLALGRRPVLVCATIGTTGTGAIDPVRQIAEVCAKHGIWLHVDAAWAGSAAVCPEFRDIVDGVELADSYGTNVHKWLLTAFDCSPLWTRHPDVLVDALSILPEFLRNAATDSGAVVDYRDWQVPLGRRFRALKLWAVLRWFGLDGLRDHIRRHVGLAVELEQWVARDAQFELGAPRSLALVCLRVVTGDGGKADDTATRAVLDHVNNGGTAFCTHTVANGRVVIRVAIGTVATERRHVRALWDELQAAAKVVLAR